MMNERKFFLRFCLVTGGVAVGCAIRRAVGGGNNGEPGQEESSGGGELLQISGNKGQEEIEIKGLGSEEIIEIQGSPKEEGIVDRRLIAQEATKLIGKYSYGVNSQNDSQYNPGTDYYVCTDVVLVSLQESGWPIVKNAYGHSSLRLVGNLKEYFNGKNFSETVQRQRRFHGPTERPEIGWAVFWLNAHVGVVCSVTDNKNGTLTVQTVEAKGYNKTDPQQNIMSQIYICRQNGNGWQMDLDNKRRAVSGYGEVLG